MRQGEAKARNAEDLAKRKAAVVRKVQARAAGVTPIDFERLQTIVDAMKDQQMRTCTV